MTYFADIPDPTQEEPRTIEWYSFEPTQSGQYLYFEWREGKATHYQELDFFNLVDWISSQIDHPGNEWVVEDVHDNGEVFILIVSYYNSLPDEKIILSLDEAIEES